VSHLKERKEKHCLNCNATIHGKFCSVCGQENIEPQESLWHLITHTFNDITHFDGKFFSSIKYIVTKPGFLSSEYAMGRRKTYLDPIRFYLFTSAFFFFIIFTFFAGKNKGSKSENENSKITKSDSLRVIRNLKDEGIDTVKIKKIVSLFGIDSLKTLSDSIEVITDWKDDEMDTIKMAAVLKKYGVDSLKKLYIKENNGQEGKFKFNVFGESDYNTLEKYDSLIKTGEVKDIPIEKYFIRKQLNFRKKYNYNKKLVNEAMSETIFHLIPQVLFISLPFFALILQILYSRNKKFYYVSHIIFSLHLYIFIYIDFFMINVLGKLSDFKYLDWLGYVVGFLGFYIFYYLYRAMRNFYEQRRGKTILKYIILMISILFLMILLLIVLFGLLIIKI
jgi:Protein of unknown function (DUF3667)